MNESTTPQVTQPPKISTAQVQPKPSPAVVESKPEIPQPINPLKDAFEQLDALAASEPEKPKSKKVIPTKAPEKDNTKEKQTDQKSSDELEEQQQSSDELQSKTSEEPHEAEQQPKSEGKGGHVASLREAYETAKARIKDLESKLSSPREDPHTKVLQERVTQYEDRIKKLENDLRDSAYERSDDYKQRFEQPLINAYKSAYEDISELMIEDADGNGRKATNEDFNRILQMPLANAAAEAAKFGSSATVVLQHRQRIRELFNARNERIEASRKEFSDRLVNQRQLTEKQHAEVAAKWTALNDEAAKKYPQWFAPQDGDDEGNKLLDSGMRLADMMFNGHEMRPEEAAKLHSAIRNKAGAFDRLVHRNKKLTSRIKELETELDEFRKSEPSNEGTKREEGKHSMTWEEELDSMASKA